MDTTKKHRKENIAHLKGDRDSAVFFLVFLCFFTLGGVKSDMVGGRGTRIESNGRTVPSYHQLRCACFCGDEVSMSCAEVVEFVGRG